MASKAFNDKIIPETNSISCDRPHYPARMIINSIENAGCVRKFFLRKFGI